MSETAKERAERLLSMGKGRLILHCQDLEKQRDELLDLLQWFKPYMPIEHQRKINDAIASVKGGA